MTDLELIQTDETARDLAAAAAERETDLAAARSAVEAAQIGLQHTYDRRTELREMGARLKADGDAAQLAALDAVVDGAAVSDQVKRLAAQQAQLQFIAAAVTHSQARIRTAQRTVLEAEMCEHLARANQLEALGELRCRLRALHLAPLVEGEGTVIVEGGNTAIIFQQAEQARRLAEDCARRLDTAEGLNV